MVWVVLSSNIFYHAEYYKAAVLRLITPTAG
jgi:hypothetical protein